MQPLHPDASPSSSLKSTSPPPSPPLLHLSHSSATPPPKPEDFHLKPCTWETLSTLPSEQRYEVVDGILILPPAMPNGTRIHQKIIANLPTLFSLLLSHCNVSAGVDVETSAIDAGPSFSATSPLRRSSRIRSNDQSTKADRTQHHHGQDDLALNVRVPDIMIKPANTESSSSPPRKSRKHVGLKLGECVIVIELTSNETRKVDMEVKWQQYFHSGIEIYIIIDIAPLGKQGGIPTVIVGSLMEHHDSIRAPTGYPGRYPPPRQPTKPSYYKREYNDDESIALHGIPDIGWPSQVITPKLLGDPKAIERLSEKTRHDREKKNEEERQGRLQEMRQRIAVEAKNDALEAKNDALEAKNDALEAEIRRLRRERGSSGISGTGVAEATGKSKPSITRSQKRKQRQR